MLLIQNALLYTMEEKEPVFADMLIKDGKIEKSADKISVTEQMEVYNAKGCRIFPGLWKAENLPDCFVRVTGYLHHRQC